MRRVLERGAEVRFTVPEVFWAGLVDDWRVLGERWEGGWWLVYYLWEGG